MSQTFIHKMLDFGHRPDFVV